MTLHVKRITSVALGDDLVCVLPDKPSSAELARLEDTPSLGKVTAVRNFGDVVRVDHRSLATSVLYDPHAWAVVRSERAAPKTTRPKLSTRPRLSA